MKVSVLVENLRRGLAIVSRGISNRASLPVLTNVVVKASREGLILSTTDLELAFRVKVRAKVEEEGEIAVKAKLLTDLVATLSVGVVELTLSKQTLKLSGEKTETEIVGVSALEFPVLPSATGKGLVLPAGELKEKVERVSIAAAKDEARPVLTGMLWKLSNEGVSLVATDGYRLGVDQIKRGLTIKEEESLVLPVRSLLELSRVIDEGVKEVRLEFDKEKQQVIFVAGEVEMSSRLIAGEFPPYEKVIPTVKIVSVVLPREQLLEAVKRAALFAGGLANVVKLLVGEGGVRVVAQSDQMGGSQSSLEAQVEGEGVSLAFNARYLGEYLTAVKEERIMMETEGELKPAVFRLPEEGFLHVIMPVRTQS